MNGLLRYLMIVLSCAAGLSCDNDVHINAKGEGVYVVYGILNPNVNKQIIRISRAFQTETDAIVYASTNDLSVKNAVVTLSYTKNNKPGVIHLVPEVMQKDSGAFFRDMTVYTTTTQVEPGLLYRLDVHIPPGEGKTDSAHVWAETRVPDKPAFNRPTNESAKLINNPDNKDDPRTFGNIPAYPQAYFHQEDYAIRFYKSDARNDKRPGMAFELRIKFAYKDPNGNAQNLTYFFNEQVSESNSNSQTCSQGGDVCYQVGKEFQSFLRQKFDSTKSYTYEDALLSKAVQMELTVMDSILFNYLRANNLTVSDFTTIKPEYTNVSGGLGVFGAIHKTSAYVRLTECTKYLTRLNGTPKPNESCKP